MSEGDSIFQIDLIKDRLDEILKFNLIEYSQALNELCVQFDQFQLELIFDYMLKSQTNYETLAYTIKKIDQLRLKSSMDRLIDLLLLQEHFSSYKEKENIDYVREQAAKALSNFKDSKAIYPLLYCLNNKDENYKLRLTCAEALGKIGDRYAVLPLINLVSDRDEKSVYLKESAVKALGMLGDQRAVDPLLSILETKDELVSKFTFLKERAVEVLAKFNFKSNRISKAFYIALNDSSSIVRMNAIEALVNNGENKDEIIQLLMDMLRKDRDEQVIETCVWGLYNLVGMKIFDQILESDRYNKMVKDTVSDVLEEIQSEEDDLNTIEEGYSSQDEKRDNGV